MWAHKFPFLHLLIWMESQSPATKRDLTDKLKNDLVKKDSGNIDIHWIRLFPPVLFLRTSSLLFSAFLIRNSAIQPDLHWKHNLSSHTDGWLRVGRRLTFHFSSANVSWAPACARQRARDWGCTDHQAGSWLWDVHSLGGRQTSNPSFGNRESQGLLDNSHLLLGSCWENYLTFF